eukprot:Clim_evm53s218 gene=Clim_evmTU53s218
MDAIEDVYQPVKQFADQSRQFLRKCSKPDRREYRKIAFAVAIGCGLMGLIGYVVKLVHMPITRILLGSDSTTA